MPKTSKTVYLSCSCVIGIGYRLDSDFVCRHGITYAYSEMNDGWMLADKVPTKKPAPTDLDQELKQGWDKLLADSDSAPSVHEVRFVKGANEKRDSCHCDRTIARLSLEPWKQHCCPHGFTFQRMDDEDGLQVFEKYDPRKQVFRSPHQQDNLHRANALPSFHNPRMQGVDFDRAPSDDLVGQSYDSVIARLSKRITELEEREARNEKEDGSYHTTTG